MLILIQGEWKTWVVKDLVFVGKMATDQHWVFTADKRTALKERIFNNVWKWRFINIILRTSRNIFRIISLNIVNHVSILIDYKAFFVLMWGKNYFWACTTKFFESVLLFNTYQSYLFARVFNRNNERWNLTKKSLAKL